jgi:4-amino-4-deoxy-L-arabinose transferase-like glycosyltransferase
LAALVTGWIVWGWVREQSREDAISTIALLAGACLMLVAAGAVMTDMTLVACTTLAMRGFWQGLHGRTAQQRRLQGWLFFVGLGLGLLAKGPLVLVLAGLPLGAWALAQPSPSQIGQRLRQVWQGLPWVKGSLLMLAIAAPWYVLAETKTPGFLDYFLVGEHWHRFVTPGWTGDRYGTAHKVARGSIWLYAVVATLPWSFLLPLVAWLWRQEPARQSVPDTALGDGTQSAIPSPSPGPYLALWSLAPLVFFTFAGNILWTYVLPSLPAMAALGAFWLGRHSFRAKAPTLLSWGLALTAAGFIAFIAILSKVQTASEHTTKYLVQHAAAQSRNAAQLIFFPEMPYSASFYSQGQAKRIKETQILIQQLQDKPALLAVKSEDLALLPSETRLRLVSVARFGPYELLATPEAAATAKPSAP